MRYKHSPPPTLLKQQNFEDISITKMKENIDEMLGVKKIRLGLRSYIC